MIRLDLVKQLEITSKEFEGSIGIAIKNLKTGESFSINGDEFFPTASVFKVPVIVELYRQVEVGKTNLNTKIALTEKDKVPGSGILREMAEGLELTIKDLAELMIIISDNTATDILVEQVGMNNINLTLHRLGFEKTKVVADCRDLLFDLIGLSDIPDTEKTISHYRKKSQEVTMRGSWALGIEHNDVSTPNEMLRLLEMIEQGKAASLASCDAILKTMTRCQTGIYRAIKYLPRDKIEFAHKTGELPGIRNDVGIVTLRGTGDRYIVSFFTKGASDVYHAEEIIANMSRKIYNNFIK